MVQYGDRSMRFWSISVVSSHIGKFGSSFVGSIYRIFWAKLGLGRYFPMWSCAQFGPIYRPCFPTSMTFLTCVLIGWNMWSSQSYLLCEPSHILSEKKQELGSLVSTSSLVSSAFISIYMMYKFFVRSSHCCVWASQYAHLCINLVPCSRSRDKDLNF